MAFNYFFLSESLKQSIKGDLAEGFLGGGGVDETGAVLLPGKTDAHDPGIRMVLNSLRI